MNKVYMCIDLKSFYASVECVERGLDPMNTNLVVADLDRTEKTICLAVSPPLKEYGLSGRSRLFEVKSVIKKVNENRKKLIYNHRLKGKSYNAEDLKKDNFLEADFIIAPPRMKLYMEYSLNVYKTYLKFLSKDDIHVYSIDEVFCDITSYVKYYNLPLKELVTKIINEIYKATGITATAGIGTNLYLCKVAMDILAKHVKPDNNGVRIAFLDELKYRKLFWNHRPLTDFWRVGKGYEKKLNMNGIYTMGDIADYSIHNEELLYKLFGVNAEILIDHAWGYEPCSIKDIKSYKSLSKSLSSNQVLPKPYTYEETKLIIKEMADEVTLEMTKRGYVSDTFVLYIGYDAENLIDKKIKDDYYGEIIKDCYGRMIPRPSRGTIRTKNKTCSFKIIMKYVLKLYDMIVLKNLLIRTVNISVNNLVNYNLEKSKIKYKQFDIFCDSENIEKSIMREIYDEKLDKKIQSAIINIKNKYGKNSILKAMDLNKEATAIKRNAQIGGHRE